MTDSSDVLVYGATGAIGSAAVQIIKSLGAHVTAVCSGEHVDLVAGLGADRVVDRTTTDFTADSQRCDLVPTQSANPRSGSAGTCSSHTASGHRPTSGRCHRNPLDLARHERRV